MTLLIPGPEIDLFPALAPDAASDGPSGPVDADGFSTDDDLALLEAMREAKVWFRDELCRRRAPVRGLDVHRLRRDPPYQIAEALYVLRALGPIDAEAMKQIGRAHNAALGPPPSAVDPGDDGEGGETPETGRNAWAHFTDDRIEKLALNWVTHGGIDQSDLGRLMVKYMSLETCRQTVTLLERAGFLKRFKSPYGAMLIQSTGELENLFARHLRAVWWFAAQRLSNQRTPSEGDQE